MFFSNDTRRWFRWGMHRSPWYRFMVTGLIVIILLLFWRFGMYTMLDAAIDTERARVVRYTAQKNQIHTAKRECTDLSCAIAPLEKKIGSYGACDIESKCQEQMQALLALARAAGLQINFYTNDQETKKEWCVCQDVQLGITGSMVQLQQFLTRLKNSSHMIQCRSVALHKTDRDHISATCGMQFITPSFEQNNFVQN